MTVSANTDLAALRPVGSKLFQATLVGAVLALIGNLLILTVGRGLGTAFMVTPPMESTLQELPFFPVVVAASVIPAIAGAILLFILGQRTERPYIIFWVIAAVVLVLSFQGPSSVPTDSAETITGLNAMHVWTALSIVGALSALGSNEE